MTPINRNPNDIAEQNYNRSHKSTRRLVENSIGILKERFPCLNHLRVTPRKAAKIVLACIALHNICGRNRDDNLIFHEQNEINNEDIPVNEEIDNILPAAEQRLNRFLQYFS